MKKEATITLTHDQALQIGFALNGAAKILESHIETRRHAGEQTKLVWKQAAERHYALSKYIVDPFAK